MQPDPHGARCGAERSSDLVAGKAVDVVEKDRVALSGRQQLDGVPYVLERLVLRCVQRGPSRGEDTRLGRGAAESHLGDVERDATEPALEPSGLAKLRKRQE